MLSICTASDGPCLGFGPGACMLSLSAVILRSHACLYDHSQQSCILGLVCAVLNHSQHCTDHLLPPNLRTKHFSKPHHEQANVPVLQEVSIHTSFGCLFSCRVRLAGIGSGPAAPSSSSQPAQHMHTSSSLQSMQGCCKALSNKQY